MRGQLTIDGEPFCDTLEGPPGDATVGCAVLPGEYWVRMASYAGGRVLPRLYRVPNGADGLRRPASVQPDPAAIVLGDLRENIWMRDGADVDGDGSIVLVPTALPADPDASRDLADQLARLVHEAVLTPRGVTITIIAPDGEAQIVTMSTGIDLNERL